jgi:hypothetical protein
MRRPHRRMRRRQVQDGVGPAVALEPREWGPSSSQGVVSGPAVGASDASAMVVHTTEDTPVGDGDPICELAHVEAHVRGSGDQGRDGRREGHRQSISPRAASRKRFPQSHVRDGQGGRPQGSPLAVLRHYGEDTKSTGYRRAMDPKSAGRASRAPPHLASATLATRTQPLPEAIAPARRGSNRVPTAIPEGISEKVGRKSR